jgi:hypothetical protein
MFGESGPVSQLVRSGTRRSLSTGARLDRSAHPHHRDRLNRPAQHLVPPAGLEPAISALRGQRPLRTGPRGLEVFNYQNCSMARRACQQLAVLNLWRCYTRREPDRATGFQGGGGWWCRCATNTTTQQTAGLAPQQTGGEPPPSSTRHPHLVMRHDWVTNRDEIILPGGYAARVVT